MRLMKVSAWVVAGAVVPYLAGCKSDSATPVSQHTVGGSVAGLQGAGLKLQNNGGDTITVDADGSFSFPSSLTNGSAYDVTISSQPSGSNLGCSISNNKGEISSADVSDVLVECVSLTGMQSLSSSGSTRQVALVADQNGNVTAVWEQLNGSRIDLWANRFTIANGLWGTAAEIETDNSGNAELPQLVVDSDNNITAVWRQSDGTVLNVWANRFDALSNSWGTAFEIDNDTNGDASAPTLLVAPDGDVTVMWTRSNGTAIDLKARRYTAGGTWDSFARVIDGESSSVNSFSTVIDHAGNVMVAWSQNNTAQTSTDIFARRFSVINNGWEAVVTVVEHDDPSYSPHMAVDSAGNISLTWIHQGDSIFSPGVVRYTFSQSWGNPSLLQVTQDQGKATEVYMAVDQNDTMVALWLLNNGSQENLVTSHRVQGAWDSPGKDVEALARGRILFDPKDVLIDEDGNITLVWRRFSEKHYNLWAGSYIAKEEAWVAAGKIEIEDRGSVFDVETTIDPNGDVLVVWRQYDGGRHNLWSSRFTKEKGWQEAEKIESDFDGDVMQFSFVSDATGASTVIWQTCEGLNCDLWLNRFSSGSGWGTAKQIDNTADGFGYAYPAVMTVDGSGRVTAAWSQLNGSSYEMLSRRVE